MISSDNLGEFSKYMYGAVTTIVVLIMVGALICNILVAVVIARKVQLYSNSSNKFVFNLSIANSVLAVLVLPFVIVSVVKRRWIFGEVWCQASGFITILLSTDSLLTAMILSIDRYHCIVNPLIYPLRMSSVKTKVLIVYTWLQSLFTAILPLIGWGKYGYQRRKFSCTVQWGSAVSEGYTKLFATSTFILPFIVMCWAYYHILKAARQQARRGRPNRTINRTSITSTTSGNITGLKAVKTTIIVLGNILLCWGVYIVTILLESVKLKTPDSLHVAAMVLSFLASFLYPVIYGIRVKAIRRHTRKLLVSKFCCCCGYDNTVRPISPSEAGFFIVPARMFRNRSVSDGSVNSIALEGTAEPDTEVCIGWCLPAIVEETDDTSQMKLPNSELTDLDEMNYSLPGQIPL